MKLNWKRLASLLLAVTLMVSLTGLGEEGMNDNDLIIDEALSDANIQPDGTESIDLPDGLDLPGLNLDLQEPTNSEIITDEADTDNEVISNALVTKVKIGVKEKYTIDTSSLSGKLTFASSNTAIASVTKKGVVRGKKVGTAKITIQTSNGKKYKVTITVANAPSTVKLNKQTATLEIGDTVQLKASLPSKTASNKMTWSSSNKRVATVTNTGKVTAVGAGNATITVKTFNGKKATCKVTVEEEEDEPFISLNATNISLSVGDTATVKVTYTGDGTIYWNTSTSGIVDCNWGDDWVGNTCELYITGKSAGSTVVTVEDRDAGCSASLNVTVTGSAGYTGDLLGIFGMDIDDVQYALDDALSYYKHDTENGQYLYTNDYMLVQVSDVTDRIEGILLMGNSNGKYTLCGIHPGMNIYTAQSKATEVGWTYDQGSGDYYYYKALYNGEAVILGINTVSGTSVVESVYMWKA